MEVGKKYILDEDVSNIVELTSITPRGLYCGVKDEHGNEWSTMCYRLSEQEGQGLAVSVDSEHYCVSVFQEDKIRESLSMSWSLRTNSNGQLTEISMMDPERGLTINMGGRQAGRRESLRRIGIVGNVSHGHTLGVEVAKLREMGVQVISVEDVATMETLKTQRDIQKAKMETILVDDIHRYTRHPELSVYPQEKKRTKLCKRHEYVMVEGQYVCRHEICQHKMRS